MKKHLPMHGENQQLLSQGDCGMTENQYVDKEFSGKKPKYKKIKESLKKKK